MTVLLVLLTAAILILVGVLASRRRVAAPAAEVIVRRYVHPGHGWARLTEDGYVVVGVDDFTQRLLGSVTGVSIPRLLRRVRQGSAAWTLTHGARKLCMVSPVSGWVVEKNESVLRDPSLINRSPYGDGWLFKVKPRRLVAELHNLLTGKPAHDWQDMVQSQLARVFSGTPALLYQDGGVVVENMIDRCTDEEWTAIANELYLMEPGSAVRASDHGGNRQPQAAGSAGREGT